MEAETYQEAAYLSYDVIAPTIANGELAGAISWQRAVREFSGEANKRLEKLVHG